MNLYKYAIIFLASPIIAGCSKKSSTPPPVEQVPQPFILSSLKVDGKNDGVVYYNVNRSAVIKFYFPVAIDHSSIDNAVSFKDNAGSSVPYTPTFENNDSTLVIQSSSALQPISKYALAVSTSLRSQSKGLLHSAVSLSLTTSIDSSDKFPQITDSALLTLVQQQTFKYFWDFGHPTSGMARERDQSNDIVTTGGTGFGVMSILTGISRNFISRVDGLNRITQIVNFLQTKAHSYHGAFPHWINGATGDTQPFSQQDDGADLVETSYLLQGLLCARQFFNSNSDATEISLRNNINLIWNAVEWNWFRQNNQDVLYWHWSPDYNWAINMGIRGWNEAMIVYVLAASSNTDSIPKSVYDNGWAVNGSIQNGQSYFGIQLPLGPEMGGPLFFAHYSFLGINPNNLSDAYANYWTQNTNHTKINYSYCVTNTSKFNGYSNICWGLTASDQQNGYDAHSPTNDNGTISPTAAISSLPYTPVESMNALKFFYYKLGDRIWGQYGFKDAFNLTDIWFASSYLAIDQGPQIVMIENYRSGLLWNLFMSCPEIKKGMKRLGFQSPNL
ncbi:MAG: beta-glucosidase [Bacteroidetes bacterium]|nr:beta-glucosidase [Bacteroidota bacterium]